MHSAAHREYSKRYMRKTTQPTYNGDHQPPHNDKFSEIRIEAPMNLFGMQ